MESLLCFIRKQKRGHKIHRPSFDSSKSEFLLLYPSINYIQTKMTGAGTGTVREIEGGRRKNGRDKITFTMVMGEICKLFLYVMVDK